MSAQSVDPTEERFLRELRHHLRGWQEKIKTDFSEAAYKEELRQLHSDPVYSRFGFARPEYVLIRFLGRMSVSIGRRLGEIYDKVPRFVAQARFNLSASDVAPKMGGKLELDIHVPVAKLNPTDHAHVKKVVSTHLSLSIGNFAGLGIEIRYNFNPNDSARLRKDEEMAGLLKASNLIPIYLIFSTISPRDEAIARLKRAGWIFLVGREATDFMNELVAMDFQSILDRPKVRAEIESEISLMMSEMLASHAFQAAIKKTAEEES